jgi:hypothetical protein
MSGSLPYGFHEGSRSGKNKGKNKGDATRFERGRNSDAADAALFEGNKRT